MAATKGPFLRVLIVPLDWGLGHATRCIPIIKLLQKKQCEVIIGASERQAVLLKEEFPTLQIIPFPGYEVTYAKRWLMLKLALQLPKIKNSIAREKLLLKQIITEHKVDWVISDNRYGLGCELPTVFLTHQLQVKAPAELRWVEKLVQQKLYSYINRFDACWVPDLPDADRGLSGQLGHPEIKPAIPVHYVGWLSRFGQRVAASAGKRLQCIIILSGPEPQRTVLENLLLPQLRHVSSHMALVRGLPGDQASISLPPNIEVYNHLPADALEALLEAATFLVSRSGYSTLMDAFVLQKKCIVIPTPGQTEQEYLGALLAARKMALVYPQAGFDLDSALEAARNFQFHFPLNSMNNLLEMAIDGFISQHFSDQASL